MRLKSRLSALEQAGPEFHGYAVLFRKAGQSTDDAKAEWEAENGPVGLRRLVIFNFGAAQCA